MDWQLSHISYELNGAYEFEFPVRENGINVQVIMKDYDKLMFRYTGSNAL